jgi:toxin HigB-1
MIKTFNCKSSKLLFHEHKVDKYLFEIYKKALIKLEMLNAAQNLEDLRIPPANRLEKLIGDRAGQYSIRINDRWRVCFIWEEGDAYDVEIVDYHK